MPPARPSLPREPAAWAPALVGGPMSWRIAGGAMVDPLLPRIGEEDRSSAPAERISGAVVGPALLNAQGPVELLQQQQAGQLMGEGQG